MDNAGAGRRYAGVAGATSAAIDLASFKVKSYSLLDLTTTFRVSGEGGIIYDEYSADLFKFVSISAGKITLGHHTSKGWFTDAVINNSSIVAGTTDYTLGVTLRGTTVSVTLNGQLVDSRAYNAVVTDGGFGLLSRTGTTSFDKINVKTDDPSLTGKTFAIASGSAISTVDRDADWNSITGWQEVQVDLPPEFAFDNGSASNEAAIESGVAVDWFVEI